jgi:hypothetical protein
MYFFFAEFSGAAIAAVVVLLETDRVEAVKHLSSTYGYSVTYYLAR